MNSRKRPPPPVLPTSPTTKKVISSIQWIIKKPLQAFNKSRSIIQLESDTIPKRKERSKSPPSVI